MTSGKFIIALDVGGSSVKSGCVDLASLTVTDFMRTPIDSRGSAASIIGTLVAVIEHHWQTAPKVDGVGVGFPGPCDYDAGIAYIKGVEKYEAIYGMNIHDALKAHIPDASVPIRFRNDAEAAIIGECVYGVGQGFSRIIGLTLGTGLGSAFVVDGVRQIDGVGVPEDGWVYKLPVHGKQSDDVFSTRGMLNYLAEASIDVDSVAEAVQQATSNPAIRQVFDQFGRDLAQFLQQFLSDFKPDVIILQGGIAQGFTHFEEAMTSILPIPVLVGKLGRDAALLGAADLFKSM